MIPSRTKKRTTPQSKNQRHGFTLLEVLITSLLMSMILASLWALSHVYSQSFKIGSFKIEESQIVRSLRQQFTDDIRGAIPITGDKKSKPTSLVTKEVLAQSQALLGQLDQNLSNQNLSNNKGSGSQSNQASSQTSRSHTHFGNSHTHSGSGSNPTLSGQVTSSDGINNGMGSSSSMFNDQTSQQEQLRDPIALPTFQLVGSRDSLQLQILQLVPRQRKKSVSQSSEIGVRPVLPAPELRTIDYTFQPPLVVDLTQEENVENETDEKDQPPPSGFMRKERAWVLPSVLSRYKASRVRKDDEFDSQSSNQLDFSDTMLLNEIIQSGAHDNEITWVPEVIAMEFRYYDGQIWQSSWDSRESNKLPVAIEIAFKIQSVVEQQKAAEEEITLEDLDQLQEKSLFDETHYESESQVNDKSEETTEGVRKVVPIYRHLIKLPLGDQKLKKRNLSDFSSGFNSRSSSR